MEMEDRKQDQKRVSEERKQEDGQSAADPHWDGSGD
mgnify:CR=1 FL=1